MSAVFNNVFAPSDNGGGGGVVPVPSKSHLVTIGDQNKDNYDFDNTNQGFLDAVAALTETDYGIIHMYDDVDVSSDVVFPSINVTIFSPNQSSDGVTSRQRIKLTVRGDFSGLRAVNIISIHIRFTGGTAGTSLTASTNLNFTDCYIQFPALHALDIFCFELYCKNVVFVGLRTSLDLAKIDRFYFDQLELVSSSAELFDNTGISRDLKVEGGTLSVRFPNDRALIDSSAPIGAIEWNIKQLTFDSTADDEQPLFSPHLLYPTQLAGKPLYFTQKSLPSKLTGNTAFDLTRASFV